MKLGDVAFIIAVWKIFATTSLPQVPTSCNSPEPPITIILLELIILAAASAPGYNSLDLQPILDCNIPKFEVKHQQFKKGKIKIVSELVFLLFLNKCVAFFWDTQYSQQNNKIKQQSTKSHSDQGFFIPL